MAKFTKETTFAAVLETPEGAEVARKHLGALLDRPSVEMMKGKSLDELQNMIPLPPIKKKFEAMVSELCSME